MRSIKIRVLFLEEDSKSIENSKINSKETDFENVQIVQNLTKEKKIDFTFSKL